jgi:hypothetical protein
METQAMQAATCCSKSCTEHDPSGTKVFPQLSAQKTYLRTSALIKSHTHKDMAASAATQIQVTQDHFTFSAAGAGLVRWAQWH